MISVGCVGAARSVRRSPEVTTGVVVVVVGDEAPVLPVVPEVADDELLDVVAPPEPDEVTAVREVPQSRPCCRHRGGRGPRQSRSLPHPPWRR